jgi:hypothetical protein
VPPARGLGLVEAGKLPTFPSSSDVNGSATKDTISPDSAELYDWGMLLTQEHA